MILPPAGLRLLLEACECAREQEEDEWQLAVEVRFLLAAGLTATHLRWLLLEGHVAQAVEQSELESGRREFRPVGNLALPDAACFVLTALGVEYARACLGAPPAEGDLGRVPVWDGGRRELRVGEVLVKRFRQQAGNQELILAAFQEEGWPVRVDDPLPPAPGVDRRHRLHDAIRRLRGNQDVPLLWFLGDGTGLGVSWRWAR